MTKPTTPEMDDQARAEAGIDIQLNVKPDHYTFTVSYGGRSITETVRRQPGGGAKGSTPHLDEKFAEAFGEEIAEILEDKLSGLGLAFDLLTSDEMTIACQEMDTV